MKLLVYRWSGRLTVSGRVAGGPEGTGKVSAQPAECINAPTVATTRPLSITLSDTFSDTRESVRLPARTARTARPEKTCWRNTSNPTVLRCRSAVPTAPIPPHTSTFCSATFAFTPGKSRIRVRTVPSEPPAKLISTATCSPISVRLRTVGSRGWVFGPTLKTKTSLSQPLEVWFLVLN